MGIFQQRYVKRHECAATADSVAFTRGALSVRTIISSMAITTPEPPGFDGVRNSGQRLWLQRSGGFLRRKAGGHGRNQTPKTGGPKGHIFGSCKKSRTPRPERS